MSRLWILCLAFLLACGQNQPTEQQGEEKLIGKLITAGGTVTEIVHALGYGEHIIATDITSTYPKEMQALPSIGYRNQIKAEGILALGADMLLAEEGYLTDDVVSQLEATGVKLAFFPKPKHIEETYAVIAEIGAFLDVPERAESLLSRIKEEEKTLYAYLNEQEKETTPRVLFIMARGPETVFIAGKETFAENIIRMAGAEPAALGFQDFVPLTPEALLEIDPDYILLFDSGMQAMGGQEGLRQIRGMENLRAYTSGNVLAFDGHYLSGFGPRVAQAALELARATYPMN
ncbi:ABC transporter substrate-binding protein [Nitritalea halalkaliphila LW7]|uniref:ABC transporter substrate-binding protein n=1 Tax=Nitritalea halalkaliphila LW7 TaxID=1189621 RepID=I5CAC2_9BACT|nr:ABC transporter substrate-binding protein [Nitritalea halalkaliphila]EIM78774.1 ABC transporter substrate-binding protein [Nitritalea halalkaliphila LW7]